MKTSNIINKVSSDRRIIFICRFLLGMIFIYASIDKISNPHAFADIIFNYKVIPEFLINFPALYLPWIELITGMFIIFGIFTETSAKIITSLLIFFIFLITFNMIRGISFDCGCFSTAATMSGSDPVRLLIRDTLLLIPGILIIRSFKIKQVKK